jgi:hypothetical protein
MQAEFATDQSYLLINYYLFFSGHHIVRWTRPAVTSSTWHYKILHQVWQCIGPVTIHLLYYGKYFHFWSYIQQFYMPYTFTAASGYFPGCQRLPRSGPSSPAESHRAERHPLTIWHYCSVTSGGGGGEQVIVTEGTLKGSCLADCVGKNKADLTLNSTEHDSHRRWAEFVQFLSRTAPLRAISQIQETIYCSFRALWITNSRQHFML